MNDIKRKLLTLVMVLSIGLAGCGKVLSDNKQDPDPRPTPAAINTVNIVQSTTPITAEASNLLFIIDSSGSMNAKNGTGTKMETAKSVVAQLLQGIGPETKVGLMAYGHRAKNDCDDVELLSPIGPVDAVALAAEVNALQPVGQTPISSAIRQAAQVLNGATGKKTIVLISDGEETCKQDPCEVAAQLSKENVELKIHVVGFGIDKASARKQLECIASSAGGLYKDAGDAATLKQTLEGMAKAANSSSGDKGRLVVDQPDSRGNQIYYCIEVYPEGVTGVANRFFESCNQQRAGENAYDIKPGRYDIWVYGGETRSKPGKRTVEITTGKDTPLKYEPTGRIFLNIVDRSGTPVQYVAQVHSKTDNVVGSGTFYSGEYRELVPGAYEVELWGGPVRLQNQNILIRSGEETKVDISITK